MGSDVSADRMKFSRGQQGEGTVATMQESSELRKKLSGIKGLPNKDTAGKERMINEPFLYPFCLNLLT